MTYEIFSGHLFQITDLGTASGISLGVIFRSDGDLDSFWWCEATSFFIFWLTDPPTFFFFFQNRKKCLYFILFIFILSYDVMVLASLILQQGVQGLQAFAFCILTANDEHTKQT